MSFETVFLLAGVLLTLSIMASVVSSRIGMPLLFLFLGIGMLAGEDGPGGIPFHDYSIAYVVGYLALAVILLDGGLRTRLETFRVGLKPALSLATIGVLLTSGLTGLIAMWAFDLSLLQGLLVGAIVGSTDAAAVFAMLGGSGVHLNQRVSATLEIESGTNDPMAIFITITLIELLKHQVDSLWGAGLVFVAQFGIALPMGVLGGWLIVRMLKRLNLASGLYPLLVTGAGVALFALTNILGGSGFLAIYLAGMVIGNSRVRQLEHVLPMHDGLAWFSQISLFLILGLLVTPHEMVKVGLSGTLVALGLIFVARPLAVLLALGPFFRFKWRELGFIAWVGLRGAVPIVLAIFPMMSDLEGATLYFNIAFYVVLMSLLLQGMSLPWMARWLKVQVPPLPKPVRRENLGIYSEDDYELYVFEVKTDTLDEVPLRQLRFPSDARVAALFRGRQLIHPSGSTRLCKGDMLCVIGRDADLVVLVKLFSGNTAPTLNRSFFGDFTLEAEAPLKDVAELYGLTLSQGQEDMTLGAFIVQRLGGQAVVGDQTDWHGIRWVVAEMSGGRVTKVGLTPCEVDRGSGNPVD